MPRACVGSSGVGTRAELNGNTPQKPPASARLGVHPARHAPSLPASPKTRESIDASLQEHHTWILELMRWSWCQQASNSHRTECCRRCRAGGAGSWATAIRYVLPRTDPSVPFVAAADSRPFADFAWCRVCWNSDFSPWSSSRATSKSSRTSRSSRALRTFMVTCAWASGEFTRLRLVCLGGAPRSAVLT